MEKMKMNKQTKNERILDMYVRLCEGKCIQKAEEALRFGVDERSIQRDIDDIRAFLDDQEVGQSTHHRKVIYDRNSKGFRMTGIEETMMSNSEILAVSKILLESRAFTKDEISSILDKLIAGCTPQENMKFVAELVANEKYHYVDLHDKSSIQDRLWELGNEIREYNLLELTYERVLPQKSVVKRTVEPVAVLFSEYYFYLIAYITKKKKKNMCRRILTRRYSASTASRPIGGSEKNSGSHTQTVFRKENSGNGCNSCFPEN